MKVSSDDLVPGDICQVTPSNQLEKAAGGRDPEAEHRKMINETPILRAFPKKMFIPEAQTATFKVVPCDFLLLNGSCVVNESILTGESIPLIKDSIVNLDENEILDIKKKHKNNILYSGTEVL